MLLPAEAELFAEWARSTDGFVACLECFLQDGSSDGQFEVYNFELGISRTKG